MRKHVCEGRFYDEHLPETLRCRCFPENGGVSSWFFSRPCVFTDAGKFCELPDLLPRRTETVPVNVILRPNTGFFVAIDMHKVKQDMAERLLEGKVALVTGAGRGLGRGFAEHLAALGCRVGVHGMRENGPAEYGEGTTLTQTAAEIGETHQSATCRVLGDLTCPEQVQRVFAEVTEQLGAVDILIHNAGGDIAAAGGKPNPNDCVAIKLEDVQSVLNRNLLSTILVCQEAAKIMMPRKQGRILTISSISAFRGIANSAIYATAKAGVVEYTRCLAEQLRPHNINVNTLAPGDTRTGRFLGTRAVPEERLATDGTLDRIGLVDEVTRVCEFFAGPLGAFVTGQVLRVDGGSQIWPA